MVNVNEQMDAMLGNSYIDDTNAPMPSSFKKMQRRLDTSDETNTELFTDKDNADEKLESFGTGVAVGTIAIPSDAVSIVNEATSLVEKDPTMSTMFPAAAGLAPYVRELEKYVGRPAFDELLNSFGIKSDMNNLNQIAGEIVSPLGAFTKLPSKVLSTLSDGAKKVYDDLGNLFDGTSGGAKLVTEGANSSVINKAPQIDDFNQPKIDLNVVGLNTEVGRAANNKYRVAEKEAMGGDYTPEKYASLSQDAKDQLYLDTGMYRGSDGKFRFKIDTSEAQMNQGFLADNNALKNGMLVVDNLPKNTTIKDILNFEDLYKQYRNTTSNINSSLKVGDKSRIFQQLGNIPIKTTDDIYFPPNYTKAEVEEYKSRMGAAYSPSTDTIYLKNNTIGEIRSTLLHEIQHAIQRREGFNKGGSSSSYLPKNFNEQVDNIAADNVNLNNTLLNSLDIKVDEGLLESTVNKLAKREHSYMFQGTDVNAGLPIRHGIYTSIVDKKYFDYNKNIIQFTQDEVNLINKFSQNKNFKNLLFDRAITERKLKKLTTMEKEAINKYHLLPGEKEAFKVQNDDSIIGRLIKQGYTKEEANILRLPPSKQGLNQAEKITPEAGSNLNIERMEKGN